MKKLQKEFKKYGENFSQVVRKNGFAIYSRSSNGKVTNYEVIKINKHNGYSLGGNLIEAAEVYPGSSLWGKQGWTCVSLNKAEDRLDDLINGRC